jgi:hypothetical protein
MLTRLQVSLARTSVLVCLFTAVYSTADAATWLVDNDGVECPTRDFASIQAAITFASPGDTIEVCPGTYIENLILDRRLTLLGAQDGVDARGRVASESIVTPLIAAVRTLELRTGSAASVIDGFTFFGGSRAIESTSGPINDLEILNNRILAFTGSGIFLNDNGINITIDQTVVDGTAKVAAGDLVHLDTDNFDGLWFTNNNVVNGPTGTGFFVDGNRNVDNGPGARVPQFVGNLINNNGTGVNLGSRAWGDGPIRGNTFSDNRFDGLQGAAKFADRGQLVRQQPSERPGVYQFRQ